jgi:S1-C subfamily serine protease
MEVDMDKRRFALIRSPAVWLLLALIGLSACQGPETVAEPEATATPAPTATATNTPTPRPTATPRPTDTPSATPTLAPLSPSAIFDLVSPSVVYVAAAGRSGSGVYVEDGYIVTNAHVVWPYTTVRVVAVGGHEFEEVPVIGWDLVADLAVLGPLEGLEAAPLALTDGEALVVGSDVYLIGYPGEVSHIPEPTLTRGLISRLREWDATGITFFQSDATIAGGQSGGALVSDMGEVIGISGFAFAERRFALVASAVDIQPRITALIEKMEPSGVGSRWYNPRNAKRSQLVSLPQWEEKVFLLLVEAGQSVDISASSQQDVAITVLDAGGNVVVTADEGYQGDEWTTLKAAYDGPYFVKVYQQGSRYGSATVESSVPLFLVDDPDGDIRVRRGETIFGALDYPGDTDYYRLSLGRGEVVDLQVDSVLVDAYLWVSYDGGGWEQVVFDDDSGGGLFGANAALQYRAPHASSDYFIVVKDAHDMNMGGYALIVNHERDDGPTPVAPPPTPVPERSPYGPMLRYSSDHYPFTILVPAEWDDVSAYVSGCPGTCLENEDGTDRLRIWEVDTARFENGGQAPPRQQLVNNVLQAIGIPSQTLWQRSRQTMTTDSGLTIEVVKYGFQTPSGTYHGSMVIAYERGIAFIAWYEYPQADGTTREAMADYTFRSLALAE